MGGLRCCSSMCTFHSARCTAKDKASFFILQAAGKWEDAGGWAPACPWRTMTQRSSQDSACAPVFGPFHTTRSASSAPAWSRRSCQAGASGYSMLSWLQRVRPDARLSWSKNSRSGTSSIASMHVEYKISRDVPLCHPPWSLCQVVRGSGSCIFGGLLHSRESQTL